MQQLIFISILISSSAIFAQTLNLSLDEAVEMALKNNPQILSQRANTDVYEAKARGAFSAFLPQVNATATYKRTTANSPAQVGIELPSSLYSTTKSIIGKRESMNSYNNYFLEMSLSQMIWDFGKSAGLYNAAKDMKTSIYEDLRSTSDNIVVSFYQTVLEFMLHKELYKASLLFEHQMENHLSMAEAQMNAGVRTNIDVLRAKSDLYVAKVNTLKMKNLIHISNLNLKNLLGISEEIDIDIQPPKMGEAQALPAGSNFDYITKRAEYHSLKLKIDALKHTLKSVKSGYFPNLNLRGAFSYNGYQIDGLVYNWNIGVQLNWNLFSGFYTMNYEEEIRAQIRMYEANLNQLVQLLYLEIENSKLLFSEASERLNLSKALFEYAEEALKLTEARYQSGLGTFVEVSDAQSIYMNAKNSYIQTEYDLLLAEIKLKKALGLLNHTKKGE